MPDLSVLSGVASAYAAIAILPGANFLVVSQCSLTAPRHRACLSALGVSIGAAILAAAALAGGQALAMGSGLAWLLNVSFAAVMAHIGLGLLRKAGAGQPSGISPHASSSLSCFRLGLATACTNPITAAFFVGLAATPACRIDGCEPVVSSVAVFAVALCWFGLVALLFSLATVRHVHRRILPWFNLATGLLLLAFAARAAMEALSAVAPQAA